MLTFHADSLRSPGQPASSSVPIPLGRTRLLHLGISAFLAFLLSACSGSSDPAIVGESPTSQPRGTLLVEPASFTLSEGATISLRAKLGSQAIGASQLTWSVSPSTVAFIDAQGTLTAIRHGEATITARYSSLQATAHGTVWPIPRSIEALSSISLAGIVGRPLSDGVQVKAISSEGVPVPGVEVTFEVISGNGILSQSARTTGSDGVARVEWTMGTVPGQQQVRARAGQLGELTFGAEVAPDYATATVEIVAGDGQASQVFTFLPEPLQVRVVDQFGNVLPGLAVEWGFSDGGGSNGASGSPGSASPSVTTTTGAQGTTEVFWKLGTQAGVQEALCTPARAASNGPVSIGGGPSGAPPAHANPKGKKFVADASPDAADSVSVTPDGSLTVVEATEQFSASLVDQYGNTVSGGSFVWTTDASGVVAVDNKGLAYGLKVGKAEVYAEDSGSKLKGSAWVNVESRAASAVQKGSGDGQKGMVNTPLPNPVAVRVVDQVGSPVAGVSVRWSVVGGAGLTAGAESSPSASAGGPDAAQTLTNSDGVAQTTWTLGTQAGQQRLEASVEGFSPLGFTAEATPGAVASITVTPAAVEMEIDESQQFSATAKDEFGNTVTGATLTWSSSNTAVASVSSAGLASAVAAGSAEIRATSGSVSGTAAVTVKAVDNGAQVASVTISPAEVDLVALEEKAQLTAVAEDSFGNPIQDPTLDATIEWQSLNPSIATVDQMGMVTAKAVGLALIVASASCCDVADTVDVRVTQVPAEVVVSPSSYTLAEGESYQLSGVVKDAMGYAIPGSQVTWSSGNPSIATVNDTGHVTGQSAGTTEIRGVHEGLGGEASVAITENSRSGRYPNEPAGFVRWVEHDMTTLPYGPLSGAGYASTDYGDNYTLIADPERPVGSGDVLRIRYPEGHSDGNSPGRFFAYDQRTVDERTILREWYVSLWVKLEGEDWEWPPNELKLWYNGVGNIGEASKGGAHGFNSPGALAISDRVQPRIVWRKTRTSLSSAENGTIAQEKVGQWLHFEFLGEISTPDVADARYQVWINGTQLNDRYVQNQSLIDGPWTTGFYEFHWAPVWGGKCYSPGCPKTRDDYMRIANLYISGIPQ
jgi:uncharacterized protein YjdB